MNALDAARTVLRTGEELFADLLERPFVKPTFIESLDAEFVALLRKAGKTESEKLFESLLEKSFVKDAAIDVVAESGGEGLAAELAAEAVVAGGGDIGAVSVAEVGLEAAGGALVTFGLVIVLEAAKFAINATKKWQLQISAGRAQTVIGATFTAALLEVLRKLNPDGGFWPDTDLDRDKKTTVRRFRRMGRKRG